MTIKKDIKNTNESKKILELNSLLKFVSILFILSATILAISKISLDGEGDKGFNQNTITVSGHSEISVKPDTTKFTITVAESVYSCWTLMLFIIYLNNGAIFDVTFINFNF